MDEWQILRPIENGAETLGFVLADNGDEAIKLVARRSSILDTKALIAIRVMSRSSEPGLLEQHRD
jgi:hypothetical protein